MRVNSQLKKIETVLRQKFEAHRAMSCALRRVTINN